jgi:hypothetical protein
LPDAAALSAHTESAPQPEPRADVWSGTRADPPAITQTQPRAAVLTVPSTREPDPSRVNRRKHPRVKVSYSALVRHPERGDDIVVCEDMSRGGLRFKSKKTYYDRSLIEIAAPYDPGQAPLLVPGQIVFVQELPEQKLMRYGVAYLQIPKPNNYF